MVRFMVSKFGQPGNIVNNNKTENNNNKNCNENINSCNDKVINSKGCKNFNGNIDNNIYKNKNNDRVNKNRFQH